MNISIHRVHHGINNWCIFWSWSYLYLKALNPNNDPDIWPCELLHLVVWVSRPQFFQSTFCFALPIFLAQLPMISLDPAFPALTFFPLTSPPMPPFFPSNHCCCVFSFIFPSTFNVVGSLLFRPYPFYTLKIKEAVFSLARTHARTCTRARTHTHTHTPRQHEQQEMIPLWPSLKILPLQVNLRLPPIAY